MSATSAPPTPPPNPWWTKIVGFGISVVGPLLHATLQSPEGQKSLYSVVSPLAGAAGFVVAWMLVPWTSRKWSVITVALVLLILGSLSFFTYWKLLNAPYETSPSTGIELLELFLFEVYSFCLFAFLSAGYRIGGDDLIKAFLDIRSKFRN